MIGGLPPIDWHPIQGGGGKGFFSLLHGIIWNNLWLDGPLDPNVDTTHPT